MSYTKQTQRKQNNIVYGCGVLSHMAWAISSLVLDIAIAASSEKSNSKSCPSSSLSTTSSATPYMKNASSLSAKRMKLCIVQQALTTSG
jgi:hypothetical protein